MKPTTQDAYRLIQEGALALAEVEAAGMRVDTNQLEQTIHDVTRTIDTMESDLRNDPIWKTWKKRWGQKASLDSRHQLGVVLFEELGLESTAKTKKSQKPKTDEGSLEATGHPFAHDYLKLQRLKKLRSTYLYGLKRETINGFCHFFFNLHLARSYRSSCGRPNIQNIPIRDKEMGQPIRQCFIPRENHILVEVDYSALEFRIAASFWDDEAMIAYASDSNLDIHRDIADQCYVLDGNVPKDCRFFAKNQFVFPTLYGSYYISCARNLWNAIESGDLKTADGVALYDHLEPRGIDRLGKCDPNQRPKKNTYERHIKSVEDDFYERFPQWAERKEQWWERYQQRGWFRLLTGFVCQGVYSRNVLYNTPIQGPAFHLLLWSLIQMVKWQRKTKQRSRIVAQIHDSIIADVHKDELDDWLAKAKQVMTDDVRRHWTWVKTPLEIEAEVSETNWWDKKEVEI